MLKLKRVLEGDNNTISFSYKEEEKTTGQYKEVWSEDLEDYYDSDQYCKRIVITVHKDGSRVGDSIIEYWYYKDEEDNPVIEDDNDEAYLERIDVDKIYRGQGIGTQLLKKSIEKAASLGLRSSVVLAPDNLRAKNWYESIGTQIYEDAWSSLDQGFGVYRINLWNLT